MRFWRFRSRELADEMRFHQEQLEAEGRSRGEAARVFGDELRLRERSRDAWGWLWLEALGRDLRLAARQLRRAPGFTAVVTLTLALGIGANAAVFAVMSAMLLRTLPVRDAGQLTLLYWTVRHMPTDFDDSGTSAGLPRVTSDDVDESYSIAYSDFVQLRQAAAAWVSAMWGFAQLGSPTTTVVVDGAASLASASLVTQDYFTGLGLSPVKGRLLNAADFEPGAPLVAVISDDFWSSRFGRSPVAIGRTIHVNLLPALVVGVAPPQFHGLENNFRGDLWLPAAPGNTLLPWGGYQPASGPIYESPIYWWLQVMVRRRPGVSQQALWAALAPRFQALATADVRPILRPGDGVPELHAIAGGQGINSLAASYSPTLRVLMAGVGLLLLLACINVAALLLARASARRREIGVRMALGAPRARLIAQLLTESVLLSLLGGGLGLVLAPLASRGLTAMLMDGRVQAVVPSLDWRVLAFTLAVSLATGVAFGLAPALRCTRLRLDEAMERGAGQASAHRMHTEKFLAVAQTALSLLLLFGAGLLVRTLVNLERQPLGFDPDHVMTFSLAAGQAGYSAAALPGFYLNLQARLEALPGVTAVGVSQHTMLAGDIGGEAVRVPSSAAPQELRHVMRNGVGAGFFASLRIPILQGRVIDVQDVRDGRPVAVINAAMAHACFGASDAIGQVVVRRDTNKSSTAFTVIGIAGDARYASLRGAFHPTYYIPYTRLSSIQDLTFEVRTAGPPASVLPAIRQTVRSIDPNLALERVQTQASQDVATLGSQRLLARLGVAFALLGLLLACIGIEGTMAYAVVRRTRDIGVRMALGADRVRVSRDVLAEALFVAIAGVVLGAGLAVALSRWLASWLYGIAPRDPATLAGAAIVLVAVAALAAWLPARRAARVDPVVALRCE